MDFSIEKLKMLEDTEQDPEVTPGLFQGDMALNNEVRNKKGIANKYILPTVLLSIKQNTKKPFFKDEKIN